MSKDCKEECSNCGDDCADRKKEKNEFSADLNEYSSVKKVIGVVSGKGGVGKSLVTSLLAATMNRRGHTTAILDADITGPSIPKAFGITEKAKGSEEGIFPIVTRTGIRIMSINLLLENESDPVLWRGPILGSTVKQFWTDVIWSDVDFMFLDMPPGTGDVPLTVFQSIPVDGIIIVTSPQELVSMIVSKAVKMAGMMKIPVIGLVENMAYYMCPDCGTRHEIFGKSHVEEIAEKYDLAVLAHLPVDPKISEACDKGLIENFPVTWLDSVAEILEKNEPKETPTETNGGMKMKIAVASENEMVSEHFGHCESFMIFDVEGKTIVRSEKVANPGHKPGFLPVFLDEQGVNVIIAGGMGGGAVELFDEKGIEVVTGARGDAGKAVAAFLEGTLTSSGTICHEHQHHDECGE
jgi:Mrp family chromosome partitioning ATPase/predicted Fe-Mo cluster-binding NifX family protein